MSIGQHVSDTACGTSSAIHVSKMSHAIQTFFTPLCLALNWQAASPCLNSEHTAALGAAPWTGAQLGTHHCRHCCCCWLSRGQFLGQACPRPWGPL
eukprot:scaffold170841_cov14-Tisochrysis_lutea.AAC.1